MPLGKRFDAQKAIETILYVAPRVRDPSFHTISKVLYFADKMHLANYGCAISGDDYVAMRHGPVPSGIYDLLKAVRGDGQHVNAEEAAAAFTVVEKFRVRALREANRDYLGEADFESLNAAIQELGQLSFDELTRRSHDSAWHSADENDIIDFEEVVRATTAGDEIVRYLRDYKTGRR